MLGDPLCARADNEPWAEFALSGIYHIDLATEQVERLSTYDGLESVGDGVVWDPDGRAVFLLLDKLRNGEDDIELHALRVDSPDETVRVFEKLPGTRLHALRAFPLGRTLLFDYDRDAREPGNLCHAQGDDDTWSYRSALNLTADLRALRSPAAGGFLLQGTASDLNFARYALEYAHEGDPERWLPVAPPVGLPALDETLAVWVPPAPGRYHVRLTAIDRAGNTRTALTSVSWADSPISPICTWCRAPSRRTATVCWMSPSSPIACCGR